MDGNGSTLRVSLRLNKLFGMFQVFETLILHFQSACISAEASAIARSSCFQLIWRLLTLSDISRGLNVLLKFISQTKLNYLSQSNKETFCINLKEMF